VTENIPPIHDAGSTHRLLLDLALAISLEDRADVLCRRFLSTLFEHIQVRCAQGYAALELKPVMHVPGDEAVVLVPDNSTTRQLLSRHADETPAAMRHFPVADNATLIIHCDTWSLSETDSHQFMRILDKLGSALQQSQNRLGEIERSRRLSLATHAGGIGVWEYKLSSQTLNWDEEMFRLFEVDPAQFSGGIDDFRRWLDPADAADVVTLLGNLIKLDLKEPAEYQFRITTPGGVTKKLAGYASLTTAQDGSAQIIGVNYDITELELARTQSLYRSQLENLLITLSMKMVRADATEIDYLTTEALRDVGQFVGADRAYRMDYLFDERIIRNTHEWCRDGITPEIDNLQNVPIDDIPLWVNTHTSGLPFYCTRVSELPEDNVLRNILEPQQIRSIVTIPLIDNDRCTGFIGFDAVHQERHWTEVDITILKLLAELLVNAERRRGHEQALQEANAALRNSRDTAERLANDARAANEAKSRFVARVSHEIRTPLHAIMGLTDIALEHVDDRRSRQTLHAIHDAGATLLEIINDILDFSKVEANEITIEKVVFSPADILEKLSRMFLPLAKQQGLELIVNLDDSGHMPRIGDALRIRQILHNFVSNAIKFTSMGSVSVSATVKDEDLLFSVTDTGIGIASADQPRLFDAFYQVDDRDSRSYSGTGLGLTIAHQLANKLDATIAVASEKGKGSTFTLQLRAPRAAIQATEDIAADGAPVKSRPLSILLAEDDPINQQLTKAFLASSHCLLDIVPNGAAAVDAVRNHDFDLILLDCQMPVMDGYAATAQIRELSGPRTPIVAITASALEQDKQRCLQADMDDVLTKPFSKRELLRLIERWTATPATD